MLDFDLAKMYQVETRVLKQAVRRNIDRFPDDFMFRLSSMEANSLINNEVSHFVIPKGYNQGGADVFAFTELGVAMLSSVLRSSTAIQMNVNIMRAFVAVRRLILNTPAAEIKELQKEVKELKQDLEEVFTNLNMPIMIIRQYANNVKCGRDWHIGTFSYWHIISILN